MSVETILPIPWFLSNVHSNYKLKCSTRYHIMFQKTKKMGWINCGKQFKQHTLPHHARLGRRPAAAQRILRETSSFSPTRRRWFLLASLQAQTRNRFFVFPLLSSLIHVPDHQNAEVSSYLIGIETTINLALGVPLNFMQSTRVDIEYICAVLG